MDFDALPAQEGFAARSVPVRDGMCLHAVCAGPADGPLVVLLHGFPEFWWSWRSQLRALAAAGFWAVAPDMPGYGNSSKPLPGSAHAAYDMVGLANDVAGLIAELQRARGQAGQPATVVCHDWGGAIGWAVAALHPAAVAKLAVLNAPHPAAFRRALWRHPSQLAKSWYIGMFQVPGLAERAILRDPAGMMARTFLSAAGKREVFGRRDFEMYGAAIARPDVLPCALGYYRSIAKAFSHAEQLATPIRCPVEVLWGRRDPALGGFLAEDARRWCHGSFAVRYFDGAGHWLQQEEAAAVNDRLVAFAGR